MKYAFVDAQDKIVSTGFTSMLNPTDPIPEGSEQVHVIDGHVGPEDPSLYQMVRQDIVRKDGKLTERFTQEWLPLEDVKSEFKRRLTEQHQIFLDSNWPIPSEQVQKALTDFADGTIRWTDIPNAKSRHESFQRAYIALDHIERREATNSVLPAALSEISDATTPEDVRKIHDTFDSCPPSLNELPCENCASFRGLFKGTISRKEFPHGPDAAKRQEENHPLNTLAGLNSVWSQLGRECATSELQRVIRIFHAEPVKSEEPVTPDLGDTLVFARQDFGVHLGADVKAETALDKIHHVVHGFWTPIDRTGTLPTAGLKMSCDPIPDATGFNKTLELVMLEEAKRVWANDGPVNVAWSGGIDSTGALVALLRTADRGDLDRLIVYYTEGWGLSSVGEYPLFFENFISGKLNKKIITVDREKVNQGPSQMFDSPMRNEYAAVAMRDELVVTGEFGDQLFGSAAFANNPEKLDMSSEDFLEGGDLKLKSHIDDIRAFNAKSPVDTTKLTDMLWWWNFAVKWNEIAFRSSIAVDDGSSLKNVHHFYQHEDFQKWSIANPHLKIGKTPESYKFALKDFIYDYAKDADYRDKKRKVGSLRVRIGRYAAIDNKLNIIKFGDTSTDTALMKQKYGDSLQRFVK